MFSLCEAIKRMGLTGEGYVTLLVGSAAGSDRDASPDIGRKPLANGREHRPLLLRRLVWQTNRACRSRDHWSIERPETRVPWQRATFSTLAMPCNIQ